MADKKATRESYGAALAALGTKREETVVFEDAFYAICTASRDGFPTVAIDEKGRDSRFSEACDLSVLAVKDYRDVDFSPYLAKKEAKRL